MKHIATFAPIITIKLTDKSMSSKKYLYRARKVIGNFEKQAPEVLFSAFFMRFFSKIQSRAGVKQQCLLLLSTLFIPITTRHQIDGRREFRIAVIHPRTRLPDPSL